MKDQYFARPEVSNSDLSELKKLLYPTKAIGDIESAYRFGTLVDAIITEPGKVDYFNRTVAGVDHVYAESDFETAKQMKVVAYAHPSVSHYLKTACFQKVMTRELSITHDGNDFTLPVRCKWDLWFSDNQFGGWGGDLKSTAATTLKGFKDSIEYFDYDRQRAWYMDIAGAKRDVLIGISKVNFEVFVVPISANERLYKQGKEKYQELAWKYYELLKEAAAQ